MCLSVPRGSLQGSLQGQHKVNTRFTMYVCICNRVTTSQLAQDYAAARARCGTQCGKCVEWLAAGQNVQNERAHGKHKNITV